MFSRPAARQPVICPAINRSAHRLLADSRHQNKALSQRLGSDFTCVQTAIGVGVSSGATSGSGKGFETGQKKLALPAVEMQVAEQSV
jgi:hypothetical protein